MALPVTARILAAAAIFGGGLVPAVQAQTVIYGGGAASPGVNYAGPGLTTSPNPTTPSELASFQALDAHYRFKFYSTNSGKAQAAFAADDPTKYGDTNAGDPVQYIASESFIAPGSPLFPPSAYPRLASDGPYIEIPMLGVGVAIPALSGNPAVTGDGALRLTDTDLCGIFSGRITSWSSVPGAAAVGVSGTISVAYRIDSAGTSFNFSNHLGRVCNSGNSNFTALSNAPTNSFARLFSNAVTSGTNVYVPASLTNFVPYASLSALVTGLAGTVTTAGGSTVGQAGTPLGIGYTADDLTHISTAGRGNRTPANNPDGTLASGFINTNKAFVAALKSGASYLTPTTTNITQGLTHPGAFAANLTPPSTASAAANQLAWVPSVPVVTQGYPIVGYSNWVLSTCYKSASVAAGLVEFLNDHYTGKFSSIIASNGYVVTPGSFNSAIIATFLRNSNGFNLNVDDPSPVGGVGAANNVVCAGKAGR